jgi:hypothetical protein
MRMATFFKNTAVIVLIILGGIAGYWLARENRRFFEWPHQIEHSRSKSPKAFGENPMIAVGMDTWQVKEALGPPEKRRVVSDDGNEKKEVWMYGDIPLYFINGFLIGWRD